ncbi:MAG: GNAT family N-acetyltransferase [Candidatus Aminicenantes bacterium]|nr:GNAT family N-acetyltransferase [Candidatus Aminicenantes bacterium]
MSKQTPLLYREKVLPGDAAAVRAIVASSGYFHGHEIDVAVELVDERLQKGLKSGYYFVFAEQDGRVVGYCCYGPIACTEGSFDLYWIAVDNEFRSRGIGRILLQKSEERIVAQGGRAVWVETSGQEKYQPTRDFYLHNRYQVEAVLKDFYAAGDDKYVFVKRLSAHGRKD